MANALKYNPDSYLVVRKYQQLQFYYGKSIGNHEKNRTEKCGDFLLFPIEELPGHIKDAIQNPQVVIIALFVLAEVANAYLFYSVQTKYYLKKMILALPLPTSEQVRFGAWILASETIFAYSVRAQGRYMNEDLKNAFYGTK
ncbi:MAG: hypothetical protein KDK63_00200 [Chlamydiia bacterium]|nr:hypothetical protein [Chlamydiia bacterium]